ncbi:MAG TPA: VWA domain-containing protein [Vicinamibacteria bacterium]|nr:VWA domain-containing protein [Vicinamibacteria bacterium]
MLRSPFVRCSALAAPLVVLLALEGGGAAAQESVPSARAELVQLDVVVTDARGAGVPLLRREDFEVEEDGRRQAIVQFFSVRPRLASAAAATSEGPVAAESAAPAAAAAAPGRQVVVVVDDLHIGLRNLAETKKALHRMVDEVLAPDDNVGLVTTSGASPPREFTRDHTLLKQAIDRLAVQERTVGRARNTQMTAEQAALVLRGDWGALQLAANAMIHEPGSVLSPTSPQVAVDAAPGAARVQEHRPPARPRRRHPVRHRRLHPRQPRPHDRQRRGHDRVVRGPAGAPVPRGPPGRGAPARHVDHPRRRHGRLPGAWHG